MTTSSTRCNCGAVDVLPLGMVKIQDGKIHSRGGCAVVTAGASLTIQAPVYEPGAGARAEAALQVSHLDFAGLKDELEAAGHGTHKEAAAMAIAHEFNARSSEMMRQALRLAEQMYRSALGATERAELSLAEFDRQAEGALARSSDAVEEARRALNASRRPGIAPATGDRLEALEADLKHALKAESAAYAEKLSAREPLERTWREAATNACNAALLVDRLAAPDVHELTYLRRARHETTPAAGRGDGAMTHRDQPRRNGVGS
jgi:hypothetical protein